MSAQVFSIYSGKVINCGSDFVETNEQKINKRVLALMRDRGHTGATIGNAQLWAKRFYRDQSGISIGNAVQLGIKRAINEASTNPPGDAA